jgi:hypothetical protein
MEQHIFKLLSIVEGATIKLSQFIMALKSIEHILKHIEGTTEKVNLMGMLEHK